MRISDWSSDVCSSDLRVETVMNDPEVVAAMNGEAVAAAEAAVAAIDEAEIASAVAEAEAAVEAIDMRDVHEAMAEAEASLAAIDMDKVQIGRASCRERVCQYV